MPTVHFENSDEPLSSWELGQFLALFRATYCQSLAIKATPDEILRDSVKYMEIFGQGIPDDASKFMAGLVSTDYEADELRIDRIVKTSPLEIAFIGALSALTLAAIFSGGKVDLKNLKFTLPPLGVGIRNLRMALRLPPAKRTKKSERKKEG